MPGNLALVKFIKAPAVERKQLPQVLQFEAAQSIPYLLSEVVWDWLEVAGDGADMEFMIAAAKTDAMEELCVAVGTANLEPELALPGVLALWQAYQYNYCDVPEDTVVIDIGARSTHLLFAGAGRFMVRTLTLAGNTITQAVADSLKLSFIEAEALKRQVMGGHTALAQGDAGGAAVAEAAELFCQRLQVEVARSLLGYGRQVPGFLPVKVLLTGGGAGVPIPPDMVLFGEISLSGALRPVGQTENRLKEAAKLGFTQATVPARSRLGGDGGLRLREMADLAAFTGEMFGAG